MSATDASRDRPTETASRHPGSLQGGPESLASQFGTDDLSRLLRQLVEQPRDRFQPLIKLDHGGVGLIEAKKIAPVDRLVDPHIEHRRQMFESPGQDGRDRSEFGADRPGPAGLSLMVGRGEIESETLELDRQEGLTTVSRQPFQQRPEQMRAPASERYFSRAQVPVVLHQLIEACERGSESSIARARGQLQQAILHVPDGVFQPCGVPILPVRQVIAQLDECLHVIPVFQVLTDPVGIVRPERPVMMRSDEVVQGRGTGILSATLTVPAMAEQVGEHQARVPGPAPEGESRLPAIRTDQRVTDVLEGQAFEEPAAATRANRDRPSAKTFT